MLTNEERKDLGNYRASLRVRLGLTQMELAERADVNVKTLQAAEEGVSITEDKLRAIAASIGVPLGAYVETGEPVRSAPASAS